MAGVRKSYSKRSLEELLSQKEEIKREINSRMQGQQQGRKTRKLSDHSILATITKDPSLQPAVQAKVKQLLQFIIYGNQVEAEKILNDNPKIWRALLTQKTEVVDYSGRKIFGTALQLAMGAKDVRYHDDEERMVEMLMKYYRRLRNGESIIASQIAEQFPDGFEKQEEQRRKRDSEALHKVINAIANSSNDKQRDKAIKGFVDYLKLQTTNTLTTGYHSNEQLLIEALKLYDENYEQFGGWDSVKNNYCWRKVIGNIERYLTACDAQAFCQCIYDIIDFKRKLTRSLTCRYDENVKFYPLDSDPCFLLGDDFAWERDATPSACAHASIYDVSVWLGSFVEKKQQHCEHLRSIDANLRRVRAP